MVGGKGKSDRLLDPIDRISEVLFGLIMVLVSTGTLSVATAGRVEIRTMVLGALGCNLAWGIIDAALHLIGRLDERARSLMMVRSVRGQTDPDAGRTAIADTLPKPLASVVSSDDLESMRTKLRQLDEPPAAPALTRDDAVSAVGICLWVFLSTFPVVIPFLLMDQVRPALRISNAIAIAMLFVCGYALARATGLRPWPTGLVMVVIGGALAGIAILLGG